MFSVHRILLIFMILYGLTGCQGSTDERVTTDMDAVEVTYQTMEGAQPLQLAESSEMGEVIDTIKIRDLEMEFYRLIPDESRLAVSITIGAVRYAVGEIGYGDMEHFPVEQVEVLGHSYIKVTGALGANSPVANYILPDPERPLNLHIEAHTVEADVDQDGTNEIVATVGTAAVTTVYKLQNGQIMACDLNDLLKAQVVMYDPKANLFEVQSMNHPLAKWRYLGSNLIFVE